MVWFIEVRAIVHEILTIKISKDDDSAEMMNQQKPLFSNTNISKTVSHSIINNTIF